MAEAVAERIPAELISADAMQVYRDLPTLTNQAPARLVGIWPLDHEASVGEFERSLIPRSTRASNRDARR